MDASLNLDFISDAIGFGDSHLADAFESGALPTPARLQQLLAEAEIQLFLGREIEGQELIQTAWYLHGVASADTRLELYSSRQQRQAFAVSAHIFDLTCMQPLNDDRVNLERAFASQVGFHRSGGEPNAGAIGRRMTPLVANTEFSTLNYRLPTLAVSAGISLLSLDTGAAAVRLRRWRGEILAFSSRLGTDDPGATIFGPTILVINACYDLLRYLRRGIVAHLDRAREALDRAVSAEHVGHDHLARWVASHLRTIGDAVSRGSVWSLMPDDTPDAAKQAFTMTAPQILTLWPPQRELLEHEGEPVDLAAAKRLVVGVPTSAGKTLIAQLLMVQHLAAGGTGVCYVAPQRSLGREVRRAMVRRLRLLAREAARVGPDHGLPATGPLADLFHQLAQWTTGQGGDQDGQPAVAIMTPERLAHSLREDADDVLSRYGMFVFDEAHQIREKGRGFLLESIISYLHWRTMGAGQHIVLLSAALGNAAQIRSWIDPNGEGRLFQSDWRGPRRLTSLFGVRNDPEAKPRIESVRARGAMAEYVQRHVYPAQGVFRLKPTGQDTILLTTRAPLGELAYRATAAGARRFQVEQGHSTAKYKMLAQMVSFLGHAGSVLVVCDERKPARNMAAAIADVLPRNRRSSRLVLATRQKLGSDHPLVEALEHGVAYHHAGLPSDLLETIEDAVREGELNYLVSTSTLTDGVNLPVRTVVLNPSHYPDQPEDQRMSGPRLLNAIGRAGRAVLETEGWVVMADYRGMSTTGFEDLEPNVDELTARSVLTRDTTLEELETFEQEFADTWDAAMSAHGSVADFQAFVWFALAAGNIDLVEATEDGLLPLLDSTLAFSQLPESTRQGLVRVARLTAQQYLDTDDNSRRAWARMGTTVNSARQIEHIAASLAQEVITRGLGGELADPHAVLEFFDELDVWTRLTELPESPREWRFRERDHWDAPMVDVEIRTFLSLWMAGVPIPTLADDAISAVHDRGWRLELAVDTVSDFCEHYFAWLSTVLVSRVNQMLSEAGHIVVLCEEVGTFIRYGVSSNLAVELITAGVRSRELANTIARTAEHEEVPAVDVRGWLGELSFDTWRERFSATQLDLVDLVEYARPRASSLLRDLLLNGTVSIDMPREAHFSGDHQFVTLARDTSTLPPHPLALYVADAETDGVSASPTTELIGFLPPKHHAEAELVIESGTEIRLSLSDYSLTLTVLGDDD
ncbi:DEAD/DEAH box helicase [Mycobacterium intracellulare]|uniref:DEAD/DEAH box helicase n=1 Tax=Mycobacterium intracellulare TaxID=1767 RepID=UPI000B0D64BE|nr:DEAD/DEAH box helicase [Mycobacterium intracellulare]